MARPLRMDLAGGWYHVTARGNERGRIYRDDRDRGHFLDLLGVEVERYLWKIHSYVLMDNHYHLEVETPQANLSAGMHWLQVAYSVWFNLRHHRVGHLFQGRFKAIVVEPETWGVALSHYIHLNPVRVKRFGLDKEARARQRLGAGVAPSREELQARLEVMRNYRWSSYRAYAGMEKAPVWLECGWTLKRMGGRSDAASRRRYRDEAQELMGVGKWESPWEHLEGQVLLGAKEWVEGLRKGIVGDEKEQPSVRKLREQARWVDVVRAVERVKGERWEEFRDRHGDWGRDMVLLLARRRSALKLSELGQQAGGVDYRSVSSAIKKMAAKCRHDGKFSRIYNAAKSHLQKAAI